ncbi:MAG: hypothetical protein JJE04_06725 [Acidobacteriia bacterium]|nr:hypothetical protein [Terriglobia bacterium]
MIAHAKSPPAPWKLFMMSPVVYAASFLPQLGGALVAVSLLLLMLLPPGMAFASRRPNAQADLGSARMDILRKTRKTELLAANLSPVFPPLLGGAASALCALY